MSSADQLIEIFHEARARSAGPERDGFLAEACRDNAELKTQVLSLMQAHEGAGDFLGVRPAISPTIEADLVRIRQEKAGERIGRYKLLQEIGEGGFGVVWMAEQTEPVSRQVALKIIKMGMDSEEVIARFEAERQALAMMDHPNIAQVFDAGATQLGRPFFVMELVKGVPITQFCDERQLGTRERLALFGDVCAGINHAHQKGVIHRDIKPSNVMITLHDEKPVVKVIDFGIAKATQGKLTDKTLFTRFEQLIGTPAYMSPEQAGTMGLDVDTRSDIYALGILLYELLTGKPPFDAKSLASAGYEEMRRIIREVDPPKPSSRVSAMVGEERTQVAKTHHTELGKTNRLVEPDLDWIVMKAIEKDRTRRYETANGLALDIQRFLADEPVSATPPSAGYRFGKFARRNKAALRVAAGIAVLLVAATLMSSWQALRATKAEMLATERLAEVTAEREAKAVERENAETISTVMREVFQSRDPSRVSAVIPVPDKLAVAAKKLESDLAYTPARRAKLQAALADICSSLGSHRESVSLREKVLRFHEASAGPSHPDTLLAMQNLATSYHDAGRNDEALKLREKVLAIRREKLGAEHRDTLLAMGDLAESFATERLLDQALELRENLLSLRRRLQGPTHPDTVFAMQTLSIAYYSLGRREEALRLREEVVAIHRKLLGAEHLNTMSAIAILGVSYLQVGSLEKAAPLLAEVATRNPEDTVTALVLAAVQVWRGQEKDHAATCDRMQKWASDATKCQDVERVAKLSCLRPIDNISNREAALALARRAVNLARGNVAVLPWAHVALGMAEYRCGHYLAADEALTTAVNTAATTGPYRSYTDGTASFYRVMSLCKQGRQAEALELFRRTEKKTKPLPVDEKNPMADGKSDHEDLILWLARKEARTLLLGSQNVDTIWAIRSLEDSNHATDRLANDAVLLAEASGVNPGDSQSALKAAAIYVWYGKTEDHTAICRRMLDWAVRTDDYQLAERVAKLACLRPIDDASIRNDAVALARRALELGKGKTEFSPWAEMTLGMAEYRSGHYPGAERALTAAASSAFATGAVRSRVEGIASFYRAMTLFKQNNQGEARDLFAATEKTMKPLPADETSPMVDGKISHDYLILWLAYKEARALLNDSPAKQP